MVGEISFSDVRNSQKNRISEYKKIKRFSVQKIPKTRIFMHLENRKEQVDFPSWEKLDLRIGKILKVEDVLGADKLYKLEVDVGEDKPRTLVAGIKQHYKLKELLEKQVVVFCNLEKKKLKGIESQGMILAAVNEGKVVLISPEAEIEVGSRIR